MSTRLHTLHPVAANVGRQPSGLVFASPWFHDQMARTRPDRIAASVVTDDPFAVLNAQRIRPDLNRLGKMLAQSNR